MIKKITNYFKLVYKMPGKVELLFSSMNRQDYDLKNSKVIVGKLFSELNNQKKEIRSLQEVEFQVFSQWGDDGIIQYLINNIDIPNKTFVEFGVENYKESNTRFLLINDNWSGLVIDGSKNNIDFITKDLVSWAHELHAVHSFITKENINSLLSEFLSKGYEKEIGILSVDIDGNDYWVWDKINVVNPIIVISEYNSIWGSDNSWTIEYNPSFVRGNSNSSSHIYYGASLLSLCDLAEAKGYYFIGCNSNGNNAYFIRKDKIGKFKPLDPHEGYVVSKFRELVNDDGTRVSGKDRFKSLIGMSVYNTRTNTIEIIKNED